MENKQWDYVKPWKTLEDWQQDILETQGSLCLRSGRQVGKSTIIAIKAGEYAVRHRNQTILVISAVERQAFLLFEKILAYLKDRYETRISIGKERPTRSKVQLKNGSVIYCLPTGMSGYGIRGYTVNLLIADEAAFIPEDVWTAVSPMLAVTKGVMWLLSTPHGKEGYFYRAFSDPHFTKFHRSSEECPRRDDEFLKAEKDRMTKAQYWQEYLGEFVDELRQFFPDELSKSCMVLRREGQIQKNCYLGVDVARMGRDESTFEIIHKADREKLIHIENQVTRRTYLSETTKHIIELDKRYKFNKIYIDDGGIGVGVFDHLLLTEQTRKRVVAINNAQRVLDREHTRRKKLLKEDLYNNLLRLMEQGKIKLLDDPEIFQSLKSVQYEYVSEGNNPPTLRIFGNYTHIVEGLIRAAWCVQDKTLNISIHYI